MASEVATTASHGRLRGMHDRSRRRALVPIVATALALAYPAAVAAGPWALAGVTIAAAVSGCALALARRPSRGLRLALAAVAAWLALGLGGAWLLQARPVAGFAWVLFVLYLLPLPAIPALYARTLDAPASGTTALSGRDGEKR